METLNGIVLKKIYLKYNKIFIDDYEIKNRTEYVKKILPKNLNYFLDDPDR